MEDRELYSRSINGRRTVAYDGPPHTTLDTLKILEVSRRRIAREMEERQKAMAVNQRIQDELRNKP